MNRALVIPIALLFAGFYDDGCNDCRTEPCSGDVCTPTPTGPTGSTGVAVPSLQGTNPASPGTSLQPTVMGSARPGLTVDVFAQDGCAGGPAATVTADTAGAFSVSLTVQASTTTQISALARNAQGDRSPCTPVQALAYTHLAVMPPNVSITGISPPSPSQDAMPVLSGRTEPGAEIEVYATASCLLADFLASGQADAQGDFAVSVAVRENSSNNLHVVAVRADGERSPCSAGGAVYLHDATPPPPPLVLSTLPASPANANTPTVLGLAEPGALVTLFADTADAADDCLGAVVGTALADLRSGLFSVTVSPPVPDNRVTRFSASATDAVGLVSDCSWTNYNYVEDSSAQAVVFGDLNPASPSQDPQPRLRGFAESGATVSIFLSASDVSGCSGAPAVELSAETFATSGAVLPVLNNRTTYIWARARDGLGNPSACTTLRLSYTHDTLPPDAPFLDAGPTTVRTNQNKANIEGGAELGATVINAYAGPSCQGAPVKSAPMGAGGDPDRFQIEALPAPQDNTTYVFSFRASDAAGNISACSAHTFTVVEDSIPPPVPAVMSIVAGSDPWRPTLTVRAASGFAHDRYTLRIHYDYPSYPPRCGFAPTMDFPINPPGLGDSWGQFYIELPVATGYRRSYRATVIDSAGNESHCGGTWTTYSALSGN